MTLTPEDTAALVEQLLRDADQPVRRGHAVGDRPSLDIGAHGVCGGVTITFRALEDDLSRLHGWINVARFELGHAFSAFTVIALRGRPLDDLQRAVARALLGLQDHLLDITGAYDEPEHDELETLSSKTARAERVAYGATVLRDALRHSADVTWDPATQTISADKHDHHVTIKPLLSALADAAGEYWTNVAISPLEQPVAPRQ